MIKVGINGFGRIGRLAFRSSVTRDNVQVVAINDLLDVDYLAYMLKYDSVHGNFDGTVDVKNGMLVVNGNEIRITAERDPANLKWNEVAADYVIESTGFFLTEETAGKHLLAGAKKVIFDFFDNVKVNDEDKSIKKNRLELLQMLCRTFDNYINFSNIETK